MWIRLAKDATRASERSGSTAPRASAARGYAACVRAVGPERTLPGYSMSRLIAAIVMLSMGLAGCLGGPNGASTVRLHEQAQAALTRWAAAVAAAGGTSPILPVGELTGQVGDWEPAVGDNNKPALMAGLVTAGSLPADRPPDGEVAWQDGTTATVPLLTAGEAVTAIRNGAAAPCGDCVAMAITAAQLATGPISTSRGPAVAPLWEFSIEGTAVKVTRLAVADVVTVVPPPWDANNPPIGLTIDSATGTVGGLDLTVAFVGAPNPGNQACGADYSAEAAESDLAVVVIVIEHANTGFGGCAAVGARRTATVKLAAPLGDRVVLDVQEGLPVATVLTP